ncbi:Protein of unknown function [Ruaniaceae bacterium KH17]|nr:Protein of unknown function [Ruaniaceae bacterium KH17]
MGRGRQKAKQTKVARKLKYFSPETDYSALERELTSNSSTDEDLYVDKYADLVDDDEDDDEWAPSSPEAEDDGNWAAGSGGGGR